MLEPLLHIWGLLRRTSASTVSHRSGGRMRRDSAPLETQWSSGPEQHVASPQYQSSPLCMWRTLGIRALVILPACNQLITTIIGSANTTLQRLRVSGLDYSTRRGRGRHLRPFRFPTTNPNSNIASNREEVDRAFQALCILEVWLGGPWARSIGRCPAIQLSVRLPRSVGVRWRTIKAESA